MPAQPVIQGRTTLDADVSAVNTTSLAASGLLIPAYGTGLRFWFHVFIIFQQLSAAGGIRYRLNGPTIATAKAIKKDYDIDAGTETIGRVVNFSTQNTFVPIGNGINYIEFFGTGLLQGSGDNNLQFAQVVADPAATVILSGSTLGYNIFL